jgi:hypothetical protein
MTFDEALPILRWVVWLLCLLFSCAGSWYFYRRDKGIRGGAKAIFFSAVLFQLAVLANDALGDYQDSREREKVSERILGKIEGARVSTDVIVDGGLPGLGEYRVRLESLGCFSGGDRGGAEVFLREKNCLPDPASERTAADLLESVILEIEVFRKPQGYVGCGEKGMDEAKADFSVRVSATLSEGRVRLAYDSQREVFILRTKVLERSAEDFQINHGEVLTAGELVGARLLVRLRSFSAGGDVESNSLATVQMENFQIKFTGSQPVAAGAGWRHIRTDPPTYLVCLENEHSATKAP